MCGIIGYTGRGNAVPYLITGLESLEYRGYDSSGIAVSGDVGINVIKSKGRISELKKKIPPELFSGTGIGHTRWATHGEPSDINAHPHTSCGGMFTVVHNGIIENYIEIKKELTEDGFTFRTETDTEAAANLLEKNYTGDFLTAVRKTVKRLSGSFAFGIMCRDYKDTVIYAKRSSPLCIGIGKSGIFAASDVTALCRFSESIYRLSDGEIAVTDKGSIRFYDENGEMSEKKPEKIFSDTDKAKKGKYAHFMLKEIYEQPSVVRDTVLSLLRNGEIYLQNVISESEVKKVKRIYLVACGSAYHAALTGKYVIEELARIPAEAVIASEYRYCNPIVDSGMLTVFISQSGETADTLASLRLSKKLGAKVISVINARGSSMEAEGESVIYTRAGPEIAVATTKAYSAQLSVMYILGIYLAEKSGKISDKEVQRLIFAVKELPEAIKSVAEKTAKAMQKAALDLKDEKNIYFIGRGIDYCSALEGSLKMKEISYIHSEGYGGGELKHGSIALIENGTPVIAVAAGDRLFPKILSNIKEVKARGAMVICITTKSHVSELGFCDETVVIPETEDIFYASLSVVVQQLLAYYTAKSRGCDIDKPRNLAKSVTVE